MTGKKKKTGDQQDREERSFKFILSPPAIWWAEHKNFSGAVTLIDETVLSMPLFFIVTFLYPFLPEAKLRLQVFEADLVHINPYQ